MNAEPTTSIQALWDAARHALAFLIALFGPAADIAAARLITTRRRAEILAWLRPIEHLLRRLIYIRAANLAPKPINRRPKRQRAPRFIALDLAAPESWPAPFRIGVPSPFAAITSGASSAPANRRTPALANARPGVHAALAIARRLEAVRRVLERPEPYAQRLARRVPREPEIARALARPPRARHLLCAWAIECANEHIRPPPDFNSS